MGPSWAHQVAQPGQHEMTWNPQLTRTHLQGALGPESRGLASRRKLRDFSSKHEGRVSLRPGQLLAVSLHTLPQAPTLWKPAMADTVPRLGPALTVGLQDTLCQPSRPVAPSLGTVLGLQTAWVCCPLRVTVQGGRGRCVCCPLRVTVQGGRGRCERSLKLRRTPARVTWG